MTIPNHELILPGPQARIQKGSACVDYGAVGRDWWNSFTSWTGCEDQGSGG